MPEEKEQNKKLAKANNVLEAISYIATHYLQEPFREDQIIYLVQEVQQFRQQAPIVQIVHWYSVLKIIKRGCFEKATSFFTFNYTAYFCIPLLIV